MGSRCKYSNTHTAKSLDRCGNLRVVEENGVCSSVAIGAAARGGEGGAQLKFFLCLANFILLSLMKGNTIFFLIFKANNFC